MNSLGNKMIMAENIKRYMKIKGVSRNKLSDDLNISYTTITDWINGKTYPRIDKIEMLANYFGVEKSDLVESRNEQPTNIININSKIVHIPVLGEIACGEPILAEENITEYREVFADSLPSGETFFLKAKGDSMEPKIPDGSFVLIRQQPEVENGEIAAVIVNGDTEATLKRVRKFGDSILLEAINEAYEPYLINEDNPGRIIGKAVRMEVDF